MESSLKTKKRKAEIEAAVEPISHFEPGKCPGREYFEKRDKNDREMFTEIVVKALGDVPKYMRMAGDNRLWLWLLSCLVAVDTAMICTLIVMVSRLPK